MTEEDYKEWVKLQKEFTVKYQKGWEQTAKDIAKFDPKAGEIHERFNALVQEMFDHLNSKNIEDEQLSLSYKP